MKEKKGFTLIELLAVIAILAILLIIAIPSVIKMYNNAKENTFVDEAQSILNTATKQFMSDQIGGTSSSNSTGGVVHYCYDGTANSNPLDLSGNKDIKYNVFFKNGKVVLMQVSNGSFNINESSDNVDVADLKASGIKTESVDINCTKSLSEVQSSSTNDSLLTEAIAPSATRSSITTLVEDINDDNYSFNDTAQSKNQNGIYKSVNTNSGNPTYYFRGDVTNNYVQFGEDGGTPILWRIVRINEDGSVRLIKETGIDSNNYYAFYPNAYTDTEGMYYSNTNVTNSSTSNNGVKKILESWYTDNLSSLDSKIAQSEFCEEPRVYYDYSKSNYPDETYLPYAQYAIRFTCQTVANHGIVNAKIGLLSYDEVVYAGGYRNSESGLGTYYLTNSNPFWLVSPAGPSIDTTSPHAWKVTNTGNLDYSYIDYTNTLRPVISLKADTEYTLSESATGDAGSVTNPYIVE